MSRRAHYGVVAFVLCFFVRGFLSAATPVGSVHLTPGWATFGQAVPEGMAVGGLQVGSLPTQTDVKTRWPDGSIRFAIVTALVDAEGQYPLTPAPASVGTFAPPPRNISVVLTIGGVAHTATATIGGDPWLRGPLVTESRQVIAPVSPSGPHPFLRVNFDTRRYNDGDTRVDVSVENMLNMTGATTVTYDAAITVDGATMFNRAAVEHYYLTRWRQSFNLGEFSTVTPDINALNLTKAVPPYLPIVANQVGDATGPEFDILREGALDRNMPAHGGRAELAPYPDWTARYLVHKDPAQKAFVLAHGDLSGSWPVHVREPENAEVDEFGTVYTGVGSERLVSLQQRPTVWLDIRAQDLVGDGIDYIRGTPLPIREYGDTEPGPGQSGLIPDNAHQPSLAYVPYLLTGDRYYAEEMAFWANYGMLRTSLSDGVRGSMGILENQETRAYAWALRNLVDAAAYYPDASPVRNYLEQRVLANLEFLDAYANSQDPETNPFKILWLGYRGSQDAGFIALWEQNYLAWSIDRANKQGYAGGLDHRDAIARLQLALFNSPEYPRFTTNEEEVTFDDGTVVPAGTRMDWGAPYLLNVATVPDPERSWENPTYFTSMSEIAAGTQQGPTRFDRWRPYPGYYGPEARLNLMIGVEGGWAGAQAAYDYLYPFIGNDNAACSFVGDGSDRPDLACRAGWALGFYPEVSEGDPDADNDSVPDVADNCSAVANPLQENYDNDAFGDACDTDDDNDGVSDALEIAAGSDPTNEASRPEVCDGVDNDLDGVNDDGFPNLDGDTLANCIDPDDDNDGFDDAVEIAAGSNPMNAASTPEVCDGSDNDLDGTIDEGTADSDADGQADCADLDDDNDGVADGDDRFPLDGTESADADNDGTGDNADLDDDNDGALDANDAFPLDPAESVDTDHDGIGNNADPDDDNDTVADAMEISAGSDPLNAASTPELCDGIDNDLNDGADEGFLNTDGDAQANCVDADDDNDGRLDGDDPLPLVPNRAPSIDSPGAQTSTVGVAIAPLPIVGLDLDGDGLQFSAQGLPKGLSISPQGVVTGTPASDAARTNNATLSVSDGLLNASAAFVWTIDNTGTGGGVVIATPDAAVTFSNVTAPGQTTVTPAAPPAPGQVPAGFTVDGLPTFDITSTAQFSGPVVVCLNVASLHLDQAAFDLLRILHGEGGVFVDRTILAPDAPAPNFVTGQVCARVTTLSPFSLASLVPDANAAPVVTAPATQNSAEGDTITLPIATTDADGDTVVITAGGLPPGLNVTGQSITGTLGFTSAGNYHVTLTASDGESSSTAEFDWVVTNTNRAPVIAALAPPPATVGVAIAPVTVSATDEDNDALTYSAAGLPAGLSMPAGSRTISGTPTTAGSFDVTITVTDGTSPVTRSFTWVVQPAAPTVIALQNPGAQTSSEGDQVLLRLTWDAGSGPNKRKKHEPTFTAVNLPKNLHIGRNGVIRGHIGKRAEGVFHVTVTMHVGSQQVSQSFDWTVLSTNRAPRLTRDLDVRDSKVGATVNMQIRAVDPDLDDLTYEAAGLPPGLTVDADGRISGVLGGNGGIYRVTVRVSDGLASDSDGFDWVVTKKNKK